MVRRSCTRRRQILVLVGVFAALAWMIGNVVANFAVLDTGRQLPGGWISAALIVGLPGLTFAAVGADLSFDLPVLRVFNFEGGLYLTPELAALIRALAFYTSGFIAENG